VAAIAAALDEIWIQADALEARSLGIEARLQALEAPAQ
jgi:hypothetical protein